MNQGCSLVRSGGSFHSTCPTSNTAPSRPPGPRLPLEGWLSAVSVCPHRAVLFASMLMRKTMASRVRATILFATETGKSATLAQDLGALFSCAFNPKVSEPLDAGAGPALLREAGERLACCLLRRARSLGCAAVRGNSPQKADVGPGLPKPTQEIRFPERSRPHFPNESRSQPT